MQSKHPGNPAWEAEKQECLARWRVASKIMRVRNIAARREMIAEAGREHGPEFQSKLEQEIKRQWEARRRTQM